MKKINIGLVGFGTVGTGLVKILQRNGGLIQARTGVKLRLAKIADIDLKTSRGVKVRAGILTSDFRKLIADPEIDVIVELIGGCRVAKTVVLESLRQRKAVVTANKALLAEHGLEIFSAAKRYHTDIYYEASVAGGIPVIKLFKEGLVANQIQTMQGIVNGTANYILTKMSKERMSFKEALRNAKDGGFAEANPKLDVEGIDSAHKLVILSSLATGIWIDLPKVYTEGITQITHQDIVYADELGYVIKLLAITKEHRHGIEVRVHPTLVSRQYQLAWVNGVYNAVYIVGDNLGKALYSGRGAGQLPTASAVVADIVDVARNLAAGVSQRVPVMHFTKQAKRILPIAEVVSQYYLRFSAMDRPGVLAKISGILGRNSISIAAVIQKGRDTRNAVPIVMMTHKAVEKNVNTALAEIDKLREIRQRTMRIRVED